MSMQIGNLSTLLAWEFTHLLPGAFRRNKAAYAHHQYPILAPLPTRAASTSLLEGEEESGPFLYFVVDDRGSCQYVGKSKEKTVLKRWIRPGNGGPATHYWTHSTQSGGCTFRIADGLRQGRRYQLRFASLAAAKRAGVVPAGATLEFAEQHLISALNPAWNAVG
jgi:hypothetical protein